MPLGREPTKREKRKLKKAVKRIARAEKKAEKTLSVTPTEPKRKAGGRRRKALQKSMRALGEASVTPGKTVG